MTNLITPHALFSPIFLQRTSLFHASGLDNPFPIRREELGDISYTSRAIAVFVSNFVVMATGVGRGRICLTSFNSPTPKITLLGAKISEISGVNIQHDTVNTGNIMHYLRYSLSL